MRILLKPARIVCAGPGTPARVVHRCSEDDGCVAGYIYATDDAGLYVNLFVGSKLKVDVGASLFPCADDELSLVRRRELAMDPSAEAAFDLNIRIPAWCTGGTTNGGLYSTPATGADAFTVTVNINGQISNRSRLRPHPSQLEARRHRANPHEDAGAARDRRRSCAGRSRQGRADRGPIGMRESSTTAGVRDCSCPRCRHQIRISIRSVERVTVCEPPPSERKSVVGGTV